MLTQGLFNAQCYICSMEINFSLDNIKEIATLFWKTIENVNIFAFHGNMGAGKTTFIHALCEYLGVTSAIGSPTYSIINEYKGASDSTIYHMDFYRMKDEEEALQAGVEDCIVSGHLCLIEWPEIAKGLLPDDCFHIYIHLINPEQRSITTINSLG